MHHKFCKPSSSFVALFYFLSNHTTGLINIISSVTSAFAALMHKAGDESVQDQLMGLQRIIQHLHTGSTELKVWLLVWSMFIITLHLHLYHNLHFDNTQFHLTSRKKWKTLRIMFVVELTGQVCRSERKEQQCHFTLVLELVVFNFINACLQTVFRRDKFFKSRHSTSQLLSRHQWLSKIK